MLQRLRASDTKHNTLGWPTTSSQSPLVVQTTVLPLVDAESLAFPEPHLNMVVVKLVTTDDQSFELDSDVAYLSKTIAGLMEETDADVPVQLAISAPILEKVIEWLKYHAAADKTDDKGNPMRSLEEVKNWDVCFVTIGTKVSRAELVDLIKAANYLDIQPLLMTACASLKQDLMQFKDNYQELQKYYQVKGDLTPEDIEEISKEQKWAYD